MAEWADWRRAQGGQTAYSFDPKDSELTPNNSFWIAARYIGPNPERRQDTLDGLGAVGACRIFITEDFVELVASAKIWFREGAARRTEVVPGLPAISGCIGHHGGLFVRPAHRRLGLPVALSRLARFSIAARWIPDWDSGLLTQDPPPGRDMAKKYGFAYDLPLVRGWSAARQGPAALNLLLLDSSGIFDQARRDSAIIERHHRGDSRDALTAIVERTQEPRVTLGQAIQDMIDARKDRPPRLGAGKKTFRM
jgi:GNAT superfamily N-acetyltransferase